MKEYDQAITTSLEAAAKVVKTELVLPFVSNLEKPLENLNLGDENNIYLMEEELTAVLVNLLENEYTGAKNDMQRQLSRMGYGIKQIFTKILMPNLYQLV